jgi:hypothetical protein
MKKWIALLAILLFSFTAFAQQSGDNSDVKNTCEVSGGTWTESGGGNWACCWADWGCYGCVGGVCKIKCYNQRCRDANKIRATQTPGKNYLRIEGLSPAGSMSPIVPKPKKPIKAPTDANTAH